MGSGKSVCARFLAQLLKEQDMPVVYLRFEKLRWRQLVQTPPPVPDFAFDPHRSPNPKRLNYRGKGFHLSLNPSGWESCLRLTGNWFRTLFFFVLVQLRFGDKIVVCDRFVLDNLAQLPVTKPWVQRLVRVVLKLLPVPRLAFLMQSPAEAILKESKVQRHYRPEYVRQLLEHYRQVYSLARLAGWPVLAMETADVKEKLTFVQQQVQTVVPIKTVEEFT